MLHPKSRIHLVPVVAVALALVLLTLASSARPSSADPIIDVSLITVSALDVGFNTATGTLIYRIRGAEESRPGPLQAYLDLLDVVVGELRNNMERLYGDQFIETTDDWEVPYIADLLLAQFALVLPLGPGAYTVQNYSLGNGASDFGMGYTGLFTVKPVPEPSTMLLLGSGLIGLVGYGRKKFFKK